MIITLDINRGFSFKPIIVIPKWATGNLREAYIAHERTHYNRQGFIPVVWVVKYFTDKDFRFKEEVVAFRAEIKKRLELDIPVNYEHYATVMATQYWGMCDYKTAYKALTEG